MCSKLVSRFRKQTVKWAIVLLYFSLLRHCNVSCGGSDIQMSRVLLLLQLSIDLLQTMWKAGRELWRCFQHQDTEISFYECSCLFSSLFGCLCRRLCVLHLRFLKTVDEALSIVSVTANFSSLFLPCSPHLPPVRLPLTSWPGKTVFLDTSSMFPLSSLW